MSQEQADAVKGKGLVLAVSDAYKLAPWADLLVSTDAMWWYVNEEAKQFAGEKWTAVEVDDVNQFKGVMPGLNSGLLALKIAVAKGATKVVLLGIDMHGTHYFGQHTKKNLENTTDRQFGCMCQQFAEFQPEGVEIVNCSPISALECYPKGELADHL